MLQQPLTQALAVLLITVLASTPTPAQRTFSPEQYTRRPYELAAPHVKIQAAGAVAYSPDGAWLAVGTDSPLHPGRLTVWDTTRWRPLWTRFQRLGIRQITVSRDGKQLATANLHGTILVYDAHGNEQLRRQLPGPAYSVAFSPDGTQLAAGGEQEHLFLWELPSGKPVKTSAVQPPPITSLAYASDDMIYLAGGDHQVRRWNLANDRLSLAFTAHPSVVQGLAISADGEVIATTDGAATTRVWNARGELQHALTSPGLKPSALAIDRTGQRLLTGAHSAEPTPAACRLQWWDPQRPQPLRTIADFASEDTIVDLSSSPDTWQVATATAGGKFSVWNLKTGLLLQTLKPRSFGSPPRVPLGLDASPDGRHIAVAHDDGFVRVLDRNATQLQREIKVFPEAAACVDFAPNGNLLAVSGYDHNVKLVDPTAGKVVATLSGHQAWVLSTSFSPTGSRLATGSYDKTVRIWDVEQRKMLFQLGQHAASVECVAYAPNGRLLASASSDHVLRLWDTQDRVLLWSNADHLGAIRSIAFAPDGKTLASGSDDKTIRIWNVDGANTQLRHRMVGHRDTVWCVRFSPAGKRLVSGGADGLIGVWDVTKGQAQMLQRRHTDTVSAVLFGPHGSFFLSGGYDKQLLIWPKRGLPARP